MKQTTEYIYNISNKKKNRVDFGDGEFVVSNFKQAEKSLESSRFSIKTVLKGEEKYFLNGKKHVLTPGKFLVVNKNTSVDIVVKDIEPVKGVCLFPPEKLVNDVCKNFSCSQTELLDNPFEELSDLNFTQKIFRLSENKTGQFLHQNINAILQMRMQNESIDFESFYVDLVELLISDQLEINNMLSSLSSIKKCTKEELYKRISLTRDYIQDNYTEKINLNELAQNAFLSKYHFLRSFKALYKQSPYQYLLKLRLEKAQELKSKNYSIAEISELVGFSDAKNLRKALQKISA